MIDMSTLNELISLHGERIRRRLSPVAGHIILAARKAAKAGA